MVKYARKKATIPTKFLERIEEPISLPTSEDILNYIIHVNTPGAKPAPGVNTMTRIALKLGWSPGKAKLFISLMGGEAEVFDCAGENTILDRWGFVLSRLRIVEGMKDATVKEAINHSRNSKEAKTVRVREGALADVAKRIEQAEAEEDRGVSPKDKE